VPWQHERLCQSEVEDLRARVAGAPRFRLQHDVGGLQIAVDDPFLMRRIERGGDLSGNSESLGDGQRPARQPICERWALDQLEDERRHAITFFQSVDRADVGMVERGEQPRLAREAHAPFRIGCELRRQDLDRDVAPELGVARPIDLAHAARAKRGDKGVRAELAADHLTRIWCSLKVVCDDRHRCLEEPRRIGLVPEQGLQFVPQRRIPIARCL
jgi:hypothetical protein